MTYNELFLIELSKNMQKEDLFNQKFEIYHKMLDEKEFERWINSAKLTLMSAKGDLERRDYNWSCFKSHQAAEFATKALLHGLGLEALGHSVLRLLKKLKEYNIGIDESLISAASTLDKYYIPTRYVNAWSEGIPQEYYTKEEAERAIELSKLIINFVEEKWKSLKKESKQEKK